MEQLRINPLSGFMPKVRSFSKIIAPPYDVLTRTEAKAIADRDCLNVLHVTRAEVDLPAGAYPYSAHTYRQAKQNFLDLQHSNAVVGIDEMYLIYQIEKGAIQQTGLIAHCDNSEGFVKTHEKTKQEKLSDRIRLLETLDADVSPVLMMHAHHIGLDSFLKHMTQCLPYAEGRLDDGSVHRIWLQPASRQIQQYLSEIDALYIADGHHRLAASRHCRGQILAALFSEQTLNLLAYHRGVKLQRHLSKEELQSKLSQYYQIKESHSPKLPVHYAEVAIYLDKTWYQLKEKTPKACDLMQQLSSVRLEKYCLDPLGINRETELSYIGGLDAVTQIQQQVDSGDLSFGILIAPIEKGLIMALSDKHYHMPAKSTWFEPKVADGLVFV